MNTLKRILAEKLGIELANFQGDLSNSLKPAHIGDVRGLNLPTNREEPNSVKSAADAKHPGLWANIRAKRARGGKPAKPGSEAYPDKKNWDKLTKKQAGVSPKIYEQMMEALDTVGKNVPHDIINDLTTPRPTIAPIKPLTNDLMARERQKILIDRLLRKSGSEGSIPDVGAPHNNHNSVSDAILKNQADPSPALSHPYQDNTLHALPPPGYKPAPATPQVPVGPGGEYDIKNTMAAPLGVNKLAMYIEALNKLAKANVVMHKEDKNPSGGLTQHGRDKYNRETGSHLKAPVTQKNPKGEAKGRKASFCARMSGVKGPMKDEHGKPTRKALALRKWNCS